MITRELPVLPFTCAWHFENSGYLMDWENPKTFTEKILWLYKYYYSRLPLYYRILNKETFKELMIEKGFSDYIIPKLHRTWDKPEDIKWDALPDTFVLKQAIGNHGTEIMLVRDKSKLDKESALLKMREWRKSTRGELDTTANFRIIAEEFLPGNDHGGFTDYKLMCLGGKTRFILAYTRKSDSTEVSEKTLGIYNPDWSKPPFTIKTGRSPKPGDIERPKNLEKMVELADTLATVFELPLVRVDLYNINGRIFIGELTMLPAGAKYIFNPAEYDHIFGDMVILPEKRPLLNG